MSNPVKLSKVDARRAMVGHLFPSATTQMDVFKCLRSIQFDPIAPAGCNHDLVLQARLSDYRVGDWEKTAYEDRLIYDGWDKQASLVPFEGYPWRRIFHERHRRHFQPVFDGYPEAVRSILHDIETRGPLLPKECEFQAKNADWTGTWNSSSVTKRVLRALWHTGLVMTSGRKKGQHLYDLAERVVPAQFYSHPPISEEDAVRELVLERHRSVGLVSPSAPYEVWSYAVYVPQRKLVIGDLIEAGELVPVDVEGVRAHATPEFLRGLDSPAPAKKVAFIAPLDQLMWDRKFIRHVFGFDYAWEIYTPEAKRRWGYYVLPILFGDALVARVEFYCRAGTLEVRRWHFEDPELEPTFWEAFEQALRGFMTYCSAAKVVADAGLDAKVRELLVGMSSG